MKHIAKQCLAAVICMLVTVAWADVAVVVSSKSKVGELTRSQVAEIFLGKLSTFPDGSQAIPLEQTDGSVGREEFHSKFTNKTTAQLKAYWSKMVFSGKGAPPKEVGTADMKKLLADNPNTVGYIEKSAVDGSVKIIANP